MLYESPELEIMPSTRDHSVFGSIHALSDDVRLFGYYGGIRLLKATVKRFCDYCKEHSIKLHDKNFTLRYQSNIPHLVGLAGSSAIITACMRALISFYGITIPKPIQSNLILSVEKDELGIAAGLQDRVAQVYQGLVYMDFNKGLMDKQGYGYYEEMDPSCLPPVYIAYNSDLSESSDVSHSNLKERFLNKDPQVLDAIKFWVEITDKTKNLLLKNGDRAKIKELMNANFDRRAKLYKISKGNMKMIETARGAGASAAFTGSGGAIIGIYDGEKMFSRLKEKLKKFKVEVIKPEIAPATGSVNL